MDFIKISICLFFINFKQCSLKLLQIWLKIKPEWSGNVPEYFESHFGFGNTLKSQFLDPKLSYISSAYLSTSMSVFGAAIACSIGPRCPYLAVPLHIIGPQCPYSVNLKNPVRLLSRKNYDFWNFGTYPFSKSVYVLILNNFSKNGSPGQTTMLTRRASKFWVEPPVSILRDLSPRPQNHRETSEYSFLARMSTWTFGVCPFSHFFHIIFILFFTF